MANGPEIPNLKVDVVRFRDREVSEVELGFDHEKIISDVQALVG